MKPRSPDVIVKSGFRLCKATASAVVVLPTLRCFGLVARPTVEDYWEGLRWICDSAAARELLVIHYKQAIFAHNVESMVT